MAHIAIVESESGDWRGVYIDGLLVNQGPDIVISHRLVDQNWLDGQLELPINLSDLGGVPR